MRHIYGVSVLLRVIFLYKVIGNCLSATTDRQVIELDLQYGVVKGYSQHVKFLVPPKPSWTEKCSSQAVVEIDLSGPYKLVRFLLDYADRPRLWTFDVSDTKIGNGFGGVFVNESQKAAEVQILNRQLRVYSNGLPGYRDATINGGFLMKVVDGVTKKGSKFMLEVSDKHIAWNNAKIKDSIDSKYLFQFDRTESADLFAGFNRVVGGSYRIGNGLCRALIILYNMHERNECLTDRHKCHPDADCMDTRRSYRCRCKQGFYGTGRICKDEDECDYENGGCVHSCKNTHGGYNCSCRQGFELAADGHNCVDKNECLESKGACEHQCINTIGSYLCKCNVGYTLNQDERTCSAGSWCEEKLDCEFPCSKGVECACRTGFVIHQDSKSCKRTCANGNGGCQHICTDSPSGPVCSCIDNYMSHGSLCIATCDIKNGNCDRQCGDTPQGPQCSCPEGYILHQDGKTCLDIDECKSDNGGCSATCVNTDGGYECVCPKGYKVGSDRKTCQDIDECLEKTACDHICTNTAGSFHCTCRTGFAVYGKIHCGDVDECGMNNGGCEHNCLNTVSSYKCACKSGFRLHPNGKDCVVKDKCLPLKAPTKAAIKCNNDQGDRERCTVTCNNMAHFTKVSRDSHEYTCSKTTNYEWKNGKNSTELPSCSEELSAPKITRRVKFLFNSDKCRLRQRSKDKFVKNLSQKIKKLPLWVDCCSIHTGKKRSVRCNNEMCRINHVNLQCGTRRRRFRQVPVGKKSRRAVVTAEFELEVNPAAKTDSCNVDCVVKQTKRRLKKTIKRLRKTMDREQFYIKFGGSEYRVSRKSFKADRMKSLCKQGNVLVAGKCVACSVGYFYDVKTNQCLPCARGTYQDKEGQLGCITCPRVDGTQNKTSGVSRITECGGQCGPGYYSIDGFSPCKPCRIGFYQSEYSRTTCAPCSNGLLTTNVASTGFHDCKAKEICLPGSFYDKFIEKCRKCARDRYQPFSGQDYCEPCPAKTMADYEGATSSSQCKDRRCGGQQSKNQGYIESPNYPGNYPIDVTCKWNLVPEKGRRILVIVPEMYLAKDNCEDSLVMRKSVSPYSVSSYETCESVTTPRAFTARSKKLWIQFKSNSNNTAAGFSIPYVMFHEDYLELIEDIVRDSRLYSYQHQEILKNRHLLKSLLDVIAKPYTYFNYTNASKEMFPESFIKFLTPKVISFFHT